MTTEAQPRAMDALHAMAAEANRVDQPTGGMLPSRFQIGDKVDVDYDGRLLKGLAVLAVLFEAGKVSYRVQIPGFSETCVSFMLSEFVHPAA